MDIHNEVSGVARFFGFRRQLTTVHSRFRKAVVALEGFLRDELQTMVN